ncbi:hypothetical protein [Rubricoccus marinus]|uniref:Uncharacterized protein n=1 Tax=Rubricoccus marinus TaxID=716817 RepID=A0A259U372_9BACT|nr:hypothetical protein [Rubricoccus marinus]OZC04297.1 hypothetical protein BSZ36_15695 [Rubricoccus marinus]
MTLADRYRQMSREELLHIAREEAGDLTPEAVGVLTAEIDARRLGPLVGAAIRAQTLTLSQKEVRAVAYAIVRRPCPQCGQSRRPVNAGVIANTYGLIITGVYDEKVLVACADCREARAKRAMARSVLLGWWSFPHGPFRTIGALWQNARTLRECEHRQKPTATLLNYVAANPLRALALARRTPLAPEASGSSPSGVSSTAAERSGRPSAGG